MNDMTPGPVGEPASGQDELRHTWDQLWQTWMETRYRLGLTWANVFERQFAPANVHLMNPPRHWPTDGRSVPLRPETVARMQAGLRMFGPSSPLVLPGELPANTEQE